VSARLSVEPVAGALGAEISGIDLARPLSEDTIAAIRRAWLDHLVIFFREQPLSPAQFLHFGRRFGEPIEYPFVKGLEDHPEIIPVLKLEHERVNFGGVWHSDTAYLDVPPMASMLVAREIPPYGGDTLFANMHLAYDMLSPKLKELLTGLTAIHDGAHAFRGHQIPEGYEPPVSEHPVVVRHPETDRPLLYVNPAYTSRIPQLSADESQALLELLFSVVPNRPMLACRVRWEPNTLVFWDNRCVQHHATYDYYPNKRYGHRVTVCGDKPFYRAA